MMYTNTITIGRNIDEPDYIPNITIIPFLS